jgi:predicted Zn-dependent peptidase
LTLKSERIEIGNAIGLNLIKADKFKSSLLSYYFMRPLTKNEVTKNALLPLVLKRGTKEYDTNLKIQRELEENYGAKLSMGVNKRGEKHILRFSIETVNREYVKDKDYIYNVVGLLKSIIFSPLVEDDYFKESYVNQEKENLKTKIEGRINNKRSYAIDRCIEEMCKNEKFSIYPLGNVEDLADIDGNVLYKHYNEIINTSPIEVFYTGEYDDKLIEALKKSINLDRKETIDIPPEKIITGVQTKNMVKEDLDVVQGKLVLGYRTGIPYQDKLYNGLLLASDILGGGPNSKLFRNVREKESLAYYINSKVFKYKSIMLIDGGIEFDNFEKTIEIVKKQIEDVKSGEFTDKDIEISKKSIKSSMESIKDSIFLISEFFFSQRLSGDNRSLEMILKDIEDVRKEDIIEASSKIVLDTIYFMKNSKIEG